MPPISPRMSSSTLTRTASCRRVRDHVGEGHRRADRDDIFVDRLRDRDARLDDVHHVIVGVVTSLPASPSSVSPGTVAVSRIGSGRPR